MNGKLVIAAVALLGLPAIARAAPLPTDNAPIQLPLDNDISTSNGTAPSLTTLPSNNNLRREYPQLAWAMGQGGQATMTCTVSADGRLDHCRTIKEDPVGLGFAAATLRTAAYFQAKPATKNGQPVTAKITIPLRWQADGAHPNAGPPTLVPASPSAMALSRQIVAAEDVAARTGAIWRPTVEQETAQLMGQSDFSEILAITNAFRQGLADAAQEEAERQAHEMAAHMGEADLQQTAAFLQTPAGRAWVSAQGKMGAYSLDAFYLRVAALARDHYCPERTHGCLIAKRTAGAVH